MNPNALAAERFSDGRKIGSAEVHGESGELRAALLHLDQAKLGVDEDDNGDGQLQVADRGKFAQEHLQAGIAHGRDDRAFGLRQLAADGERNRASHRAERGRLQEAPGTVAFVESAEDDPVGAAVGRDHGVAGQRPAQHVDDRRRAPVLVDAAFRPKRRPDRSRLFRRPGLARRYTPAQRFEAGAGVAREHEGSPVHSMTIDDRREIDRTGPFRPGVAPAASHLDRIVSGKDDAVRCCHQRQKPRVDPWAQPGREIRLGELSLSDEIRNAETVRAEEIEMSMAEQKGTTSAV